MTHRAIGPTGWILLILASLYGLRLALVHGLGATGVGLHVDEAQYWHWSRDLQWGYYSKPPGIALLIALSTACFGNGLLGVKALAMACYPVTAWALGRLAHDMAAGLPEPRATAAAATLASLLFMTTPLAGLLGLAATTDAPLLLFWTLAMWALWHALHPAPEQGVTRPWLLFGLAMGLGGLSKYTMAALAVSVLILLISRRHRSVAKRGLRGTVLAAVTALLIVTPNLAWNRSQGWPTLHHTADITLGAAQTSSPAAWAEFLGGQWLMLGPVLSLVLLWEIWRRRDVWRGDRPAVPHRTTGPSLNDALRFAFWCAAPLWCVGAAQAWRSHAEINWTAPAVPGMVLWTALSLATARAQGARWPARVAWLSGVTGLAVATSVALAPGLARAMGKPLPRSADAWSRMRDWDAVFEAMRPVVVTRPGVTVMGVDRAVIAHGAYAWRDLDVHWAAAPTPAPPRHHYELTAPWQASSGAAASPVLVLGYGAPSADLCNRFSRCQFLTAARAGAAPLRPLHLELWEATP